MENKDKRKGRTGVSFHDVFTKTCESVWGVWGLSGPIRSGEDHVPPVFRTFPRR